MATEISDEFRARASQARRISDNMENREAQSGLRLMADELDAEADRLDNEETPNPMPSPTNDTSDGAE